MNSWEPDDFMMLSSSSLLSLLLCLRCLRLHCLCHTLLVLMKSWRGCVSAFHVKLPKTCSRLSQSCQPWINQRRTLVKQQRQQLDHKAMVNFIAWWSVQCSASLCSPWYLNSFHNETMVFWSSNHRSQWSYNGFDLTSIEGIKPFKSFNCDVVRIQSPHWIK